MKIDLQTDYPQGLLCALDLLEACDINGLYKLADHRDWKIAHMAIGFLSLAAQEANWRDDQNCAMGKIVQQLLQHKLATVRSLTAIYLYGMPVIAIGERLVEIVANEQNANVKGIMAIALGEARIYLQSAKGSLQLKQNLAKAAIHELVNCMKHANDAGSHNHKLGGQAAQALLIMSRQHPLLQKFVIDNLESIIHNHPTAYDSQFPYVVAHCVGVLAYIQHPQAKAILEGDMPTTVRDHLQAHLSAARQHQNQNNINQADQTPNAQNIFSAIWEYLAYTQTHGWFSLNAFKASTPPDSGSQGGQMIVALEIMKSVLRMGNPHMHLFAQGFRDSRIPDSFRDPEELYATKSGIATLHHLFAANSLLDASPADRLDKVKVKYDMMAGDHMEIALTMVEWMWNNARMFHFIDGNYADGGLISHMVASITGGFHLNHIHSDGVGKADVVFQDGMNDEAFEKLEEAWSFSLRIWQERFLTSAPAVGTNTLGEVIDKVVLQYPLLAGRKDLRPVVRKILNDETTADLLSILFDKGVFVMPSGADLTYFYPRDERPAIDKEDPLSILTRLLEQHTADYLYTLMDTVNGEFQGNLLGTLGRPVYKKNHTLAVLAAALLWQQDSQAHIRTLTVALPYHKAELDFFEMVLPVLVEHGLLSPLPTSYEQQTRNFYDAIEKQLVTKIEHAKRFLQHHPLEELANDGDPGLQKFYKHYVSNGENGLRGKLNELQRQRFAKILEIGERKSIEKGYLYNKGLSGWLAADAEPHVIAGMIFALMDNKNYQYFKEQIAQLTVLTTLFSQVEAEQQQIKPKIQRALCGYNAETLVEYLKIHLVAKVYAKLQHGSKIHAPFTIIGYLEHDGGVSEAMRIMADQGFFIMASHHEPFGLVWVEAIAAGAPAAISQKGGAYAELKQLEKTQKVQIATKEEYQVAMVPVDDQYIDAIYIVDPHSPRSLLQIFHHIAQLADSDKKKRQRAARQFIIDNMSFEIAAQRIQQQYERMYYHNLQHAQKSAAAANFADFVENESQAIIEEITSQSPNANIIALHGIYGRGRYEVARQVVEQLRQHFPEKRIADLNTLVEKSPGKMHLSHALARVRCHYLNDALRTFTMQPNAQYLDIEKLRACLHNFASGQIGTLTYCHNDDDHALVLDPEQWDYVVVDLMWAFMLENIPQIYIREVNNRQLSTKELTAHRLYCYLQRFQDYLVPPVPFLLKLWEWEEWHYDRCQAH